MTPEAAEYLAKAYNLKTVADYDMGEDAIIPLKQAAAAIASAQDFVDAVTALLDGREAR